MKASDLTVILLSADAGLALWQMDGFLITSKAFNGSIFDALIFLLCSSSRAAAFCVATAKDMIDVAAVLCVHACSCIKKCLHSCCRDGWAKVLSGWSFRWVRLYFRGLQWLSTVEILQNIWCDQESLDRLDLMLHQCSFSIDHPLTSA